MTEIAQLISTLGFPIACCIACGWACYKIVMMIMTQSKEREENLIQITREISQQIAELGQIVDKNTEAISVMNEKIGKLSDEVEGRK